MPTINVLRNAVDDLHVLAAADLRKLWRQVTSADQARQALGDVLPSMVRTYGQTSATVAADWYDELRDELEVPRLFRAIPAELGDTGSDVLARWAIDPLFSDSPDFDAALSRVEGGLQRRIANAARETVRESSVEDPQARGWQRSATSGGCAFCRMLAGRGAVYGRDSVHFAAHDHCRCQAVPAFEGRPSPVSVAPPAAIEAPPVAPVVEEPPALRASPLTDDQYAMLKPRWDLPRQKKAVAALRSTPSGRQLHDTLKGFQSGSARQIPLLRTNIAKRLAGEALEPGAVARVDNLLGAIANSPHPAPKLFRGMRLEGSADDIVARYASNDTVDLNLSSFSSDRKLAQDFTVKGAGQKGPRTKTQTGVLIEVEQGASALPIEAVSPSRVFAAEREWLSGGRYAVESVKTARDGTVVLRLRQLARLGD